MIVGNKKETHTFERLRHYGDKTLVPSLARKIATGDLVSSLIARLDFGTLDESTVS